MRTRLIRLALLSSGAILSAELLAHCGDHGAPRQAADSAADVGADYAAQDAPANDSTLVDALPDTTPSGDAGQGDSTVADSPADVGAGDAGAADTVVDTFVGIPCTLHPTDGGDVSDSGSADGAGEEGGDAADAGEAGEASEGGDAGDAGAIGTCPGAMTCCAGWCTDTTIDFHNCGACGNACGSNQFCTGVACDDAILQNVCANRRATVVDDSYSTDNAAGGLLGVALLAGCGMNPALTLFTRGQDSGLAQDPVTGRPLTGPGDTLVTAGGAFGQASVAYMDQNGLDPIVPGADGTNAWFRMSKTNANVVYTPSAMLTMHHDYFVLEVSLEPVSGTFCFFAYGLFAPGTTAAGYYFQNYVAHNLAMFANAWYVYEWTDTDNDGAPSAGDTFTLVSSGL